MTAISQQTGPETEAPKPESASVGTRIFRAALVVSLANVLAKLLGLVRIQAVAYHFGAGEITDAYWTVFNGVIMAIFLLGEECIQPAFLPVFIENSEKNGEKSAWRFASTVINAQFLVLVMTISFLMLFPGKVVDFLTGWGSADASPWYTDETAALKLSTGAQFLRMMAPALIGFSLGSLTFILLNARKKFFLASLGEGSWRAIFIAAVVALGAERFLGQWALPLGVVAGSIAKIGTHIPGLFRQLKHYRPVLALGSLPFRRFMLLIAPLIAGSAFAKVRDNFNQIWVLGDLEKSGLITVNMMGRMFTDTLGFLVPYALSVGMFPYLCEMVDRDERTGIGKLLSRSSRLMVFFFLPMAAVMGVAAVPLTRLLFEMGRLKVSDAELVGLVTACYALALPAYGVERVMMKGFFSNKNTVSPFLAGLVWSAVSMATCWLVVVRLGWQGTDALMVVALAYACTRVLKAITLTVMLKRTVPMLPFGEVAAFTLRVLALTVVCVGAAWAAQKGMSAVLPLAGLKSLKLKAVLGVHLSAIGIAATASFLFVSWALRMQEFATVTGTVRGKLSSALERIRPRR